jgi:hypothetical protein
MFRSAFGKESGMKNSIQHLGRLSVVLLVAHTLSFAQAIKPVPSNAGRVESKKGNKTAQEQKARDEQLKTLQLSTLSRTLDSIKKINEPALRISARNALLQYLSSDGDFSEEDKNVSAGVVRDSLADFSDHFEEMMPSLAQYLFSDFAAWTKKYQPALSESVETLEKIKMKGKDLQEIHALMAQPGGDVVAAQQIAQYLDQGQDIPVLVLYLNQLIAANSQAVTPLLSKIIEVAAQGQLSFETLLSVSDIYLRPQTPPALQQGFLRMVIARTQPFNLEKEPASQSAYYLLTNLLPAIKQVVPELYSQAVNQRLVVYASFNKDQVADEQRDEQLSESSSASEDLIAEADQTPSKSQRNQLLSQAAQWAMQKKKFPMCLEAIEKLDLDTPGITADFWTNWNDQFVRDFVNAVLAEKKPELAEQGTGHVVGPYAKVQSLVMISQYWTKAHDNSSARRLLMQARKVADDATDYVAKAKAFLLLSALSNQTDSSEKTELVESAIKALNSVSIPDRGDDLRPYQAYVWKLNGVESQVVTQFKDLTRNASEEALTLVERIDKPESRTFALLGILQGMRDLSPSARG